MTIAVESPLLFIFQSVWSRHTLACSWSKLRVQARMGAADQLVGNFLIFRSLLTPLIAHSVQNTALSQYLEQFNIFWSPFLLASQCTYNVKDFLMVSVFLSAFHKDSIELHGKLFSCLISPWINHPHSLIHTGSILQCETNVIFHNWLEDLRLELQYIACNEMHLSVCAESFYFLSPVATLLFSFSLE